MVKMIEFPMTPITEDTFERQGWEKHIDSDGGASEDEPSEYYYYMLPLPKDNPAEEAIQLVSSANDDYKDLGLKKGEYAVELDGLFGLGICFSEEELMILYKALTKQELETDID